MIDLAYQLTRAGITAKLLKSTARGRQTLLMLKIMESVSPLIEEAAKARISAPGLIEIMELCQYCIEENALACAPELDIQTDAVKDACAGSVAAALSNDPVQYAAAREAEDRARTVSSNEYFEPVY